MRRKTWTIRCACAAMGTLVSLTSVAALEERFEDLSVSVEVAEVFEIDVSKTLLAFTDVVPARTSILGRNRFHNEITCRSNTGRPWHLKAEMVQLKHTQTQRTLPASSLKWKVVEFRGVGEVAGGASKFHPFSEQSTLIYAGEGDEYQGRPVTLKLQYSLTPPPSTLNGTYIGRIAFTMTEAR